MYIVPLAWLYVALMMAVAEANHSQGTLLGAIITFFLYGVLPVAVLVYIMGAPARRRAIQAREATERSTARAVLDPPTPQVEPPQAQPPGPVETPHARG